jgi:parvulin-like peptidyl-prolyl isomerase
MRLMERIRTYGQKWLWAFIGIFVISVFAGLGVSSFNFSKDRQQKEEKKSDKPVQLASEGEYKDAAIMVDGRPISNQQFFDMLKSVYDRSQQNSGDPEFQFQAYGQLAAYLVRENMIMEKGKELGIKVTADDIQAERDKNTAQFQEAAAPSQSGNVVGDLAKKLGGHRERQQAFKDYLARSGMTEKDWREETEHSVMMRKTLEAVQAKFDEKKKEEATATKAKVDADLAAGMSFADVVKKYSEGPAAENGGDIGTWMQRGLLFDEKAEDVLFSTPKGKISDWIEIPAGFQKFEIYDKIEAEGPEFEAAKPSIIEEIKKDKGADYTPTDDEIAKKFQKVKARQLVLKTNEPGSADKQLAEEMKVCKVEINNPYILAYQAVYGDRIQPPAGFDFEKLKKITQMADPGADYDFSLIEAKIKKGLPEQPKAEAAKPEANAATPATEGAAKADAAVEAKPAEGAADAKQPVPAEAAKPAEGAAEAKPGEATPPAPAAEKPAEASDPTMKADGTPVPIYALGIGLLKLGLQEKGETGDYFPYYMIAKLYLDWLRDEDAYAQQPMDRAKARAAIEENLSMVAKRFEYSPLVHAYRGLNLAWLEQPDEARKSLELALKYTPKDDTSEALSVIKEAYQVLDDTAKVQEIDAMINQARQERLQKQIEAAQARQAQQQQSQTPFSAGSGQPPAQGQAPQAPPAQSAPPAAPPAQGGKPVAPPAGGGK